MIRVPKVPAWERRQLLYNPADESAITRVAGSMTRDTEFGNTPGGGMRLTQTSETALARFEATCDTELIGKYVRVHFHNHVGPMQLEVRVFIGNVPEVYYVYQANIIDLGPGQVDVHLNGMGFAGQGDWDGNLNITKVDIRVGRNTPSDPKAVVTIGAVESASRRPWVALVQDGPAKAFIEDVLPMLQARGLPATILTGHAFSDDMENPPTQYVSLEEYQRTLSAGGVHGGLHNDSQHATFDDFEEETREHIYKTRQAGLWSRNLHMCALQNNYVDEDRWNWIRGQAATVRTGSGIPTSQRSHEMHLPGYAGGSGNYNYIYPAHGSSMASLHIITLHGIDLADIPNIIDYAIENELGAHVYTHGTCRHRPDNCASVAKHRALIDRYVERQHEIDWISLEEVYDRAVAIDDRKNINWLEHNRHYYRCP